MARYIDAEIAADIIRRYKCSLERPEYKEIAEAIEDIVTTICSAADVQEVKHGRWVVRHRHEHYPSGKPYDEDVCPYCGRADHNGDGNYCGYCGAKMDGGKKNEN